MPSELLKGFRLLDLTDEKGALCGKMFADLGAEVIKINDPGNASTRRIPPYLEDQADAEHCLYSIAYHAGKKSVTANLKTADGRAMVAELAAKSDFIVESSPPLRAISFSIRLGYDALAKEESATHLCRDHAVRRYRPRQRLRVGRHHNVGGGRHDVPDGRGRKTAVFR